MKIDRRKFLHWAGIGWFVSILSGAISACTSTTNKDTETPANAQTDGFINVGTVEDLNKKGQILDTSSANPILVVRDPSNAEKIIAMNPTCTHQGCTVGWDADKKQSLCSCHGSVFGAGGEVVKGPAGKALKLYEAKIDKDSILVKVG